MHLVTRRRIGGQVLNTHFFCFGFRSSWFSSLSRSSSSRMSFRNCSIDHPRFIKPLCDELSFCKLHPELEYNCLTFSLSGQITLPGTVFVNQGTSSRYIAVTRRSTIVVNRLFACFKMHYLWQKEADTSYLLL